MTKHKINEKELAHILADLEHGEITVCEGKCRDCALSKEIPFGITLKPMSICNLLSEIAVLLENDDFCSNR